MLRPFIFVGCGGSGMRTLLRLRRELEQRLNLAGIPISEFPSAWQFVIADVPSVPHVDKDLEPFIRTSYVGLASTGVGYRFPNGVDDQLSQKPVSLDDFAKWRPNPELVSVDITKGAGQYRAVGRVVGAYSADSKLIPRLQEAIREVSSAEAKTGLQRVADALGLPADGEAQRPLVVLVSSLAGGAGSGIFMDVGDALRRCSDASTEWLNASVGILYDPTIFWHLDDGGRGGLAANSLAATTELVAGHWEPWDTTPYINRQGPLGQGRGPQYPMIVGATNGKVHYPDADTVYGAIANVLATWAVSPDVSSSFVESVQGNWPQASARSTGLALHDPPQVQSWKPVSSLGFARVSLGRDRFGRYAAERMTRTLSDRLLRQHVTDEITDGRKTEEQVLQERVTTDREAQSGLLLRFLTDCGLNEGSEQFNDVIDAVRAKSELDSGIADVQKAVREKVNDPTVLFDQLNRVFREDGSKWTKLVQDRTAQKAYDWSATIQERVLDTVAKWCALEGIPLTMEVVRQVADVEIGKKFPAELRAEALLGGKEARTRIDAARAQIESSKMRNVVPKTVQDVLADVVRVRMIAETEEQLRTLCAALLEDLAANLLLPVVGALQDALEQVRLDATTIEFQKLSDSTVPNSLIPPDNELLVDPVEDYPNQYSSILLKTAGSEVDALRDAFAGRLGDLASTTELETHLRPWLSSQRWTPNLAGLGGASAAAATPVKASFQVTIRNMVDRSAGWLRSNPASVAGAYLGQTMRSYLTDCSPAEQTKRAKALSRKLDEAFQRAAPLVSLDTPWLSAKFGYSTKVTYTYTSIPLVQADNADAHKAIDDVIARYVEIADSRKYTTDSFGDIEVYSFYDPMCPSGIKSLTTPIVDSYATLAAARTNAAADPFWTNRRSRPLDQAIPLPMSSRISLARGWIVGTLMGAIENGERTGMPWCKLTVDGVTTDFLSPPFGAPADKYQWFGSVLESALLAEMLAANGNTSAFDALMALVRLGSSNQSEVVTATYPSASGFLLNAPLPGMDKILAEAQKASGDRKADLVTCLQVLEDAYRSYVFSPTPQPWKQCTTDFQVMPLLADAAQQLREAVAAASGPDLPGAGSMPGA